MKTRFSAILVVLLAMLMICIVPLTKVVAGYDHVERPDSAVDCIDALMPIPTKTAKEFGHTDKVRLVHNIAELLKAANRYAAYEARIATLEKQVAKNIELIDAIAKLTSITHLDKDGKRTGGYDPNNPPEVVK